MRHTVLRDEVVYERGEARRDGAHGAGDEEHEQKARYDDPQHIADIRCCVVQAERGDELRREQDEKCADKAELHGAAAEEPAWNGKHEKRKDKRDEHAPQRILCIGRERAVSAGCAKVPRATCTCAAKLRSKMIVPTTPPKIMTPLQKPSTGAKIRSFKCGLPSFLSILYVP